MKSWSIKGIDLKLFSLITSTIALSAVIVTMNHELSMLAISNPALSAIALPLIFGAFAALFVTIKNKSTDNRFFWGGDTMAFSTAVGVILFLVTAATIITGLWITAMSLDGATNFQMSVLVGSIVTLSAMSFFSFYGGVSLLLMTMLMSAQKTGGIISHA